MPTISRILIRLGFIAALPLLLLQFNYIRHHREPYPAIVLPSFAVNLSADGNYEAFRRTFRLAFVDGSEIEFDRRTFLAEMPAPFRHPVLRRLFSPNSVVPAGHEQEFWDWTRERCRAIAGRPDVARLVIERFCSTRDERGQLLRRELYDRVELDLLAASNRSTSNAELGRETGR